MSARPQRTVTETDGVVKIAFRTSTRRSIRTLTITENIGPDDSPAIAAAKRTWYAGGIDPKAIKKACDELGITRPIAIKRANGRNQRGCYRAKIDPTYGEMHTISLSTYSSAYGASRTLWHELAHAAQIERMGAVTLLKAASQMMSEQRTTGYKHCIYESEANQIARDNAHRLLTVPNRRMTGGLIPGIGGVR